MEYRLRFASQDDAFCSRLVGRRPDRSHCVLGDGVVARWGRDAGSGRRSIPHGLRVGPDIRRAGDGGSGGLACARPQRLNADARDKMAGLDLTELLELALLLIAVGALSGFLAGLFGIGGGAILVPVFYECFRLAG